MEYPEKQQHWLSVHLYYEEPWETFLVKIIKPYCETVLDSGAANAYFFVRYWERGPHVRLRFRGEKQALEQILKANMLAYFNNYFSLTPSKRDEPSYHPDTPNHDLWLANNSTQLIDYEVEMIRYGGEYTQQFAEDQFFASSKAVLESIAKTGFQHWSYDDALGAAIKLHLIFIHAIGFDLSSAKQFFKEVLVHWLPLSIQRERITASQYEQQTATLLHTFEQHFAEQQEALVSYHAACWEILLDEEIFEEDYLNEWHASSRIIGQQLRLANVQNLLNQRAEKYRIQFQSEVTQEQQTLWEIYADFFHMTNNRLGIHNRDESYLAYLMMRSIEQIS